MRIYVLAAALACAVFVGCGGGSSKTPPPNPPTPPPPASISVTAPQDGATVYGTPVTVSITAKNLSDASKLSVRLNGTDITAKLGSADSNGVRTMQIAQPDVNYGKNQLQVRYQTLRANSSFTLNSGPPGSEPSQTGMSLGAELIVVQTRVLRTGADGSKATDWGVYVGSGNGAQWWYATTPVDQNGNPCHQCDGFQILMVNRLTAQVISNNSYELDNGDEWGPNSPFLQALEAAGYGPNDINDSRITKASAPTSGCQPLGCVMIMQSLAKIGYAPCYSSDSSQLGSCPLWLNSTNVYNAAYWLTKLGASGNVLFANGSNPDVAYSFIGNAGSGNVTGTGVQGKSENNNIIITSGGNQNGQFERFGCLDDSSLPCDSLGRAGSADNAGSSTDLQQAGRITGALIRDNYNLYTFAETMPQLSYTFGTTVSAGSYTNVVSINGSTAEGAGQYTQSLPSGSAGGFRLLILDRTHPDSADAKQFDRVYSFPNDIQTLENDINTYRNSNGLFFFATMGNIQHSIDENNPSFAPVWEGLVQTLAGLGAEPMTVRILGEKQPAFDADGADDYLLVGKTEAYSPPVGEQWHAGLQTKFTAQESGYVIYRHTLKNAASPTQVEGLLVPDHQGYYTPHMQSPLRGFLVPQIAAVSSASLLAPKIWPYSTADQSPSTTQGERNAYNYISNELCCSDIRSAYINLNASPSVWLTELEQLPAPTTKPNACPNGETCWPFSGDEFTTVQDQLATEFQYLAGARNLQNNILTLFQSEQSNVSLILDQAASDIKADVDVDEKAQTSPNGWSVFTSDVLPVASSLAGFIPDGGAAVQTAIAIGTVAIDTATESTNDTSGVSQTMQSLASVELAEANLAQHEADQFVNNLATLGNEFKRIVTDWGRLAAVGGPIARGQIIWDPTATSVFLRAFDITTRRQFYPTLMRANPNYFIAYVKYGDVQYQGRRDYNVYNKSQHTPSGDACHQEKFWMAQDAGGRYTAPGDNEDLRGTAWWPGVQQQHPEDNGVPFHPPAYWWDIWALALGPETNNHCPLDGDAGSTLPDTHGMFDPISEDDTVTNSGLGMWKPYVFQYYWIRQEEFNEYWDHDRLP